MGGILKILKMDGFMKMMLGEYDEFMSNPGTDTNQHYKQDKGSDLANIVGCSVLLIGGAVALGYGAYELIKYVGDKF